MDVFALREKLVGDYRRYAESFLAIRDDRIREHVTQKLDDGLLWPDPPLQLNPAFESGGFIDALIDEGVLHDECRRIFRTAKTETDPVGRDLRLHKHQADAIRAAKTNASYVLTTGTGSGKSMSYIVPIVDYALRHGAGDGRIKAIVVYPMNALANSQENELAKFLKLGYPQGRPPVTFRRYTGQESEEHRDEIRNNPPDILLTNYVMLEYLLTRPVDGAVIRAAQGLPFLVLDELHTYRGRQGADVALLVRRVRERCKATSLRCVGTSATMAGPGTFAEQKAQVASVASRLFGTTVEPENVIGETLRPATANVDLNESGFRSKLAERVGNGSPPESYDEMVLDPLASWIERTLGITWHAADERFRRCVPRPLLGDGGAAALLSEQTGVELERCTDALKDALMRGSETTNEAGFPVFAFRLHQFFSGGNPLAASLDPASTRHISTSGQQFVPGSGRDRVLLPLAFCRECGQDYFPVRRHKTDEGEVLQSREISDRLTAEGQRNGYLYVSDHNQWPADEAEQLALLPNDWLEAGGVRVKRDHRPRLPQHVSVSADGHLHGAGLSAVFIPAPFRFCLACGIAYGSRQTADYGKLAMLGAGGRSTSTTILGLSAVRELRSEETLAPEARKLLSFSDNRQDASLQAGHFNDFVEISLLRGALYEAVRRKGDDGLRYDELPAAVFAALALPSMQYATDPDVKGGAKRRTEEALRDVLEYRVYRDQARGWRITSPNLEQTGLLTVDYDDLDECIADDEAWTQELPPWIGDDRDPHPLLSSAATETRELVARALLDFLRRELAIKVDVLDADRQEELKRRSSQQLIAPWAIDENEPLTYSSVAYPRSRSNTDDRGALYISPLSGFGQFLARPGTFPLLHTRLPVEQRRTIIVGILLALKQYGLVERVATGEDGIDGYQVPAAQLCWLGGDGTATAHDQIRVPRAPADGRRTNEFFVDLYRDEARSAQGIEAREHTAQVRPEDREDREQRFRTAALPVLFCSPTMELGVDIASLNVVNLRNVPPTPANYAQRSGRAGRSGQPALVYTFCSSFNSHDQYFFARPERMVSGQVAPPQLDLANEDLVRAHVHAVWLAESGQSLGRSLTDLLDVEGANPTLELKPSVRTSIEAAYVKPRALERSGAVLDAMSADLADAPWWNDQWLDRVLTAAPVALDEACDRWRDLYRSARQTIVTQTDVITDASRATPAKNEAKRLRREAEAQLELLTVEGYQNSDFYSYRYFASEGFLPGYSFPRLPLSAFIPGRRGSRRATEDFVQRPRFLAITEFGPRSIVYHEGARYLVNKVILPVNRDPDGDGLPTERAKICDACGYLHQVTEGAGPDVCERCETLLDAPLRDLLRLQNVATRRRDRISSDEEERQRQGYEVRTTVQFTEHEGRVAKRTGLVTARDGTDLLTLEFGQAATIWRVNLGWTRRKDKGIFGFVLDTERGYWAKDDAATPDDPDDPLSGANKRVVPFVEDRRNCLLITPRVDLDAGQMTSLQAALKRAIQAEFQLEDQELAAEPLPTADARNVLLIFEAAEGGAGVLRRLIDDEDAIARVGMTALDLCHFAHDGTDLKRAKHASEDCEVACYDCLLSYGNQRDHRILDRTALRDLLLDLAAATTSTEDRPGPDDHVAFLKRRCDSELERRLIDLLVTERRRLPDEPQRLLAQAQARPDFIYSAAQVAVFVDGPIHDAPDKQADDALVNARLDDLGWEVIRFHHAHDWTAILDRFTSVFGKNGQ